MLSVTPSVFAANVPEHKLAWLQQPMSLADARHLAGRTGFGASAQELDVLVGVSRAEAINRIVEGFKKTPTVPMPVWVTQPAPRFWKRASLPAAQKQAFDRDRDREIGELRQWWVSNMLQSTSPQSERLVLFWHDHFATSYDGIDRRSISMARQNQLFREMGTGSYRAFLKAMIRDPAMLIYLDNQNNRKGRPNENLARELLELFTLGEGNYDEATVKEAARALTGYGISQTRNHTFQLHAYKRDLEEKTLFGVTDLHDGDSLIDLILQQPAAANHLVKKFWSAYVSDSEPEQAFIDSLSESFRQSDYNLLVLYKSVLSSQQFWDAGNRLSLIKSPAALLIGTARLLDFPKLAWAQIPSLHALLGMDLFAPPNVSGWTEGAAFVAPGRLLNRQLAIRSLIEASAVGSSPSANAAMANIEMSSESMTDMMSAPTAAPKAAPLQVRLAGHFFNGAPKFRVSLYNSTGQSAEKLWQSEDRELKVGYDTRMFGKMQDRGLLPWQTEHFFPADDIVIDATQVQIEFLNDAAGKTGDRNLFVESVEINSNVFSAAGGNQVSGCARKNKRYAGDLYCAGTVSIDVTNTLPVHKERQANFTATDARVIWTKQKKSKIKSGSRQKLDAIIALENVQTPDNFYHTLSFHLLSEDKHSIELRLDSYGCWPDCVEPWPECAWHAENSDDKMVVFRLPRGRDKNIDCHYQSLASSQQRLINMIWKSLPTIVGHVINNEPREGHAKNLKLWHKRIQQLDKKLSNSVSVDTAESIVINADFKTPSLNQKPIPAPRVLISSLDELEQRVIGSGLSLADLLIGGVDVSQFPQLVGSADNELSFRQQLDNILSHPVYQVH